MQIVMFRKSSCYNVGLYIFIYTYYLLQPMQVKSIFKKKHSNTPHILNMVMFRERERERKSSS